MSGRDERPARAAAELAARRSYGRLVAFLSARTGDVAGAEDALAESFATALAEWPVRGVPDNPEAWLLTAARRRMIDGARRQRTRDAAADTLRLIADSAGGHDDAEPIPEERLALMFVCAHPAIDRAVHAPLILQTALGLDAATIASAFLVAPATMSQRLVRAKTKIRQAGIPFRVPDAPALGERLGAVLEAIYAAYAEGWTDPTGADPARRSLTDEALWLGRLACALMPEAPEALGLLSLMLHGHARRAARRDAAGAYVPLADQDPAHWDAAMIDEAEDLLRRASRIGATGRYQLEAAVQSAHVVRRRTGFADWAAIERLYDALAAISDSPVVALNRAVAIAETRGPRIGLALLDGLRDDRRLHDYQPYWAALANLHARLGETAAADDAYRLAIGLETDPAVRAFLQARRESLARSRP
jgi:RNA polymerase sigma-70 factor (ECF subfamily)